ncbi:malonyl-CoA decarboxylase [Neptunomonas japonica]|uniref:Malonyl-CoA decarboxylase n=1 Tax=Neptunomonas japonica JAMM 1380 TaxID=1441457 RepID=A0A7R6SXF6_9GAMM|nr:malonyl-CoA decarboxylase [Neptunomonas japonica]BBB31456.1 malonyl-CoA decarboxylase [Neptunomonas japonica JAMM 1380]
MATSNNSFLERTFSHIRLAWREATDNRATLERLNLSPELSNDDEAILRTWIDHCLADKGGEIASRARAATLGQSYLELDPIGQQRFLSILAMHYDTNRVDVEQYIERWQEASDDSRAEAARQLRNVLEPPRMKLLTLFNELPEGIKFLVDMRAQILSLQKQHPELKPLEADLKRLLISWFDIGLLQLEQINWHSSAELLEKLIAYEAVHAITSWDDLKNRLDSDRRCFAFFHPNMPNEPLIFVEVALVKGLADNVQTLLDESAPVGDIEQADTAIFYSISNAQQGLAGISFGNFLIKRVVKELQHEFPHLKQFSTLSPIPGLTRWIHKQPAEELEQLPGGKALLPHIQDQALTLTTEQLAEPQLKAPLIKLATYYLAKAERVGGTAADSVTHFHLSNGAQIAQLNWMADTSVNGLNQAAGFMVNYLYDLPNIEKRSQAYLSQNKRSLSSSIKSLLSS